MGVSSKWTCCQFAYLLYTTEWVYKVLKQFPALVTEKVILQQDNVRPRTTQTMKGKDAETGGIKLLS